MGKKTKKDEMNEEIKAEKETSNEVEEIKEEKEPSAEEKLKAELENQKDLYLRLRAEYDNYRKRTQNEKLSIYDDATAGAVSQILPIADSITMALSSQGDDVPKEYLKGIELIAQQLKTSFEKLSITEFGEVGDEFNPEIHNAVSTVEDENFKENTVCAVYQKGFMLKDKVVRHAMVQVANV